MEEKDGFPENTKEQNDCEESPSVDISMDDNNDSSSEDKGSPKNAPVNPLELEADHKVKKAETEKNENKKSKISKKRIKLMIAFGIVAIIVIIVAMFASHIWCFHKWDAATCTQPKTCEICGKYEGAANGHKLGDWVIDTPATCTATGKKHAVCSVCKATVTDGIEKLKHTEGDWVVTSNWSITSSGTVIPGSKSLKCSVCGETIRTEAYTVQLTTSQKNAMSKAKSYLGYSAFSYSGLIHQLEYEKFSTEDATFAADNCGADWNKQAALKAKSYMSYSSFSRGGLIHQLEYEGFTSEQAEYGVNAVGL